MGSVSDEGDLRVHPVNGGGGRNGNLPHFAGSGRFEDVDGALDVDPLVQGRFLEAGSNAGAGGEVDHLVKPGARKELVQRVPVGQVAEHECERPGGGLELAECAPFEVGIVKVIEIIERPNGVSLLQQPRAHMRSDEAGSARDEDIHVPGA